jgi:D-aminoacyl-tRNA deacylase
MKAVLQRVSQASVAVDGEVLSNIGQGFLVLLGVAEGDTEADADFVATKMAKLRVFADDEGKMNLSVGDVGGELLVISQFTLLADTRKGNRPSFISAAKPNEGERLYEYTLQKLRSLGLSVGAGRFGAMMDVSLVNAGPVTIILDSNDSKISRRGNKVE